MSEWRAHLPAPDDELHVGDYRATGHARERAADLDALSPGDRLRLDRVQAWCEERGAWQWPDIPRAWLETFTDDTWTLEAAGRLDLQCRSGVTPGGTGTTDYRLTGHPDQLDLLTDLQALDPEPVEQPDEPDEDEGGDDWHPTDAEPGDDRDAYTAGMRQRDAWRAAGWRTYSPEPGEPHGVLHYCEDGHHWTAQPDGGVAPSWGFGLTSIVYDQPTDRCPEPARGWSLYDDQHDPTALGDESVDGLHHGYKCPSCGTVHYVGGCGMGVRSDPWNAPDKPCVPPAPACGKPAVRTLHWRRGNPKHGIESGWFDPNEPTEPQPGEQLTLA